MSTKLDSSLGGGSFPYYPKLAIWLDSRDAAIFLSFLIHLPENSTDADGWIKLNPRLIEEGTGIRREEHLAIKQRLREMRLIGEAVSSGIPHWDISLRLNEENILRFLGVIQ